MRHHKKTRILGRTKRGRTALMRSQARSLILAGSMRTTVAKAKELRPFIERLITNSKKKTPAARRSILTRLGGAREAEKKLYDTYMPRYTARSGGYTRIVKLGKAGKRVGEMVRIEFVE